MATFHSVQDAVKLLNAGLSGGEHINQRQEQETTNLCLWNQEVDKLKEKIKRKRRRKAASRIMAESKICANKSFPSAKEVHKSKTRSKETCLVKC